MSNKVKYIVIGVFVVLLSVAWFVSSTLEAKNIGDPCEANRGLCSGEGAECLFKGNVGYCSISCTKTAECPKGWSCGKVTVDTYSGKTGAKTKTGSTQMCFKP